MNYIKAVKACRLCNSKKLKTILDFGSLPLGNDFANTFNDSKKKHKYKLIVKQCSSCRHFQLGHEVQPNKLYATNYTYLTGVAPSFLKHFQRYSNWAIKKCNLKKDDFILDIGSNDGTCLQAFRKKKLKVLGIDPAKLPSNIANKNGIKTINKFFNDATAKKIKNDYGQIDFITSHNVLAHIGNIHDVFKNIFSILKQGGYFCFEVGYFASVVENNLFDTIYHEHLDYHHAAPLVKFLNKIGFQIVNISTNKIQGGTIRILCRKKESFSNTVQVQNFLKKEKKMLIYNNQFMKKWSETIFSKMNVFSRYIKDKIKNKNVICGYGAPTKAVLLLKLSMLSRSHIKFTVEDNILKLNKYIPRSNIKILDFNALKKQQPDYIIIFAWNFVDDIIKKIKSNKLKNLKVVVPLPKLNIIDL